MMKTLRLHDPLPHEAPTLEHPIFKRKILNPYPNRLSKSLISSKEYDRISRLKQEWEENATEKETIESISDFEKRILRIQTNTMTREVAEPTPEQIRKLKEFETYSFCVPKSKSRSSAPIPTIYTNNLESMASDTQKTRFNVRSKPFTRMSVTSNRTGIPLMFKTLVKKQKSCLRGFNDTLRYHYTCDNQVEEERIKQRVDDDRASRRAAHEKKIESCARLGQQWALVRTSRSTGAAVIPRSTKPRTPIPPEDQEALDFLKKREEDLLDEIRLKEKESRVKIGTPKA